MITPSEIEDRLEEAALTLRRLPNPAGSGARGYGRSWPEYVHEAKHAYGYEKATMRVIPNARTHSDEQIAQIAASIIEFGFTNPILIGEDSVIIAGHGRLLAAQRLEMTEVPTITLAHLSEVQRRALVIADNRIAENAGWNEELLAEELAALQELRFDLDLVGFSDDELADLLGEIEGGVATGAVEGEDDIPATPVAPVSRPGDLWVLGNHRLLCGDSTVAADVERVLDGVTPLLMVTDPPYGVDYDPDWRNRALGQATARTGKVLNDDRADWREAWALFPGDVAYVWHGDKQLPDMAAQLVSAGFQIRNLIVWAKDRLVLSRGDYHSQHETCWYAVRKSGKGHWAGDRKQTTLWAISHRDQDAETRPRCSNTRRAITAIMPRACAPRPPNSERGPLPGRARPSRR